MNAYESGKEPCPGFAVLVNGGDYRGTICCYCGKDGPAHGTTAMWRAKGYDAARACNYREAAHCYWMAAELYPTRTGKLALADIAKLERFAADYLKAAEFAESKQTA